MSGSYVDVPYLQLHLNLTVPSGKLCYENSTLTYWRGNFAQTVPGNQLPIVSKVTSHPQIGGLVLSTLFIKSCV
jgi:hypothetical protein